MGVQNDFSVSRYEKIILYVVIRRFRQNKQRPRLLMKNKTLMSQLFTYFIGESISTTIYIFKSKLNYNTTVPKNYEH